MTKKCRICKNELEVTSDNFYAASGNNDGFNNKCKACVSKYNKEYHSRPNVIERRIKTYRHRITHDHEFISRKKRESRQRIKTDDHKLLMKEYRSENKDKILAQNRLNYRIRSGTIIRPTICELCNRANNNIDAHHHNGYDEAHWYDVMWLCRRCHIEQHKKESKS